MSTQIVLDNRYDLHEEIGAAQQVSAVSLLLELLLGVAWLRLRERRAAEAANRWTWRRWWRNW